ncbi:phage holin family protein [Flavobacterium sp. MXW15]|uniref:Phage holin family protein n=1 Tax=Xanthomonas chitinilytica TaxID=2989819 RepID=A0ABT3K0L9_9XANT|nr:phage holin family protein [Xanthomonas sp. H13-6]MCW4456580.1 phage holin family protein [Flavobacterium sp. MXW15]MCW4474282.1 phage holin family protein [Xanthomonas sp. H13-6]
MSDQPQPGTGADGNAEGGDAQTAAAPGLEESLRQVGQAGRAATDSAKQTARALRRLAAADFALARSAFGRALAWTGAAVVFGASAWFLLAGTIIALLQRSGFSWLQSLLFTALGSLVVTGIAVWRVSHFFDYTGMHATRRQLSRLGLFDEDGDDEEDEGDAPATQERRP